MGLTTFAIANVVPVVHRQGRAALDVHHGDVRRPQAADGDRRLGAVDRVRHRAADLPADPRHRQPDRLRVGGVHPGRRGDRDRAPSCGSSCCGAGRCHAAGGRGRRTGAPRPPRRGPAARARRAREAAGHGGLRARRYAPAQLLAKNSSARARLRLLLALEVDALRRPGRRAPSTATWKASAGRALRRQLEDPRAVGVQPHLGRPAACRSPPAGVFSLSTKIGPRSGRSSSSAPSGACASNSARCSFENRSRIGPRRASTSRTADWPARPSSSPSRRSRRATRRPRRRTSGPCGPPLGSSEGTTGRSFTTESSPFFCVRRARTTRPALSSARSGVSRKKTCRICASSGSIPSDRTAERCRVGHGQLQLDRVGAADQRHQLLQLLVRQGRGHRGRHLRSFRLDGPAAAVAGCRQAHGTQIPVASDLPVPARQAHHPGWVTAAPPVGVMAAPCGRERRPRAARQRAATAKRRRPLWAEGPSTPTSSAPTTCSTSRPSIRTRPARRWTGSAGGARRRCARRRPAGRRAAAGRGRRAHAVLPVLAGGGGELVRLPSAPRRGGGR